uniref:Uncharacterized protein n=1 Tax=Romanomermis culicivorax TaxID=13658 RepID=A0A915IBZ8_ROMCU
MQIEEMDNQRHKHFHQRGKHLHRNGVPKKDEKVILAGFKTRNERIPRGNTLDRSPPRGMSAGNLVNLGEGGQQGHAALGLVIPDQTPVRFQPLQQNAMHFTPQDAGVPIEHPPAIAIDQQEAGPANPNPDANIPWPQTLKRSQPKVELAGPKKDVITPKF